MASSLPIANGNPQGDRRPSILSNFIPDSLPVPPSFLATSPMVREILQQDITDCLQDHEHDHDVDDIEQNHNPPASPLSSSSSSSTTSISPSLADAKLAFHPNGVAFGCGYSTVPLPGLDRPVPNPREIEESLHAEVDLLRDNDIIPPRQYHHRGSVVDKVYRQVFGGGTLPDGEVPVDYEASPLLLGSPAEETPLLIGRATDYGPATPLPREVHEIWEEAVAAQRVKTTVWRETKTLVQYSAPLIATFLLHYSVTIGSVLTVGRLGMLELAAVNCESSFSTHGCPWQKRFLADELTSRTTVATMTASITCYVPVQGLSTCLDTLCSQAYGSGHKHLVGLQAQRMTWLLWLIMIPIAVLWWFSEPILMSLVPSADTAQLAATYLKILIIGMPGVAAFESGKRFVQSQGLFHATTYTLLIGAPLSFFQNWLFVFYFGWNFAGAAMAMAITQNLLPLLLALYVWRIEGSQCWDGLSWKAFKNWGE